LTFGKAVRLIQQRQRVEERARNRGTRPEQPTAEPSGPVTEAEAYDLLGVSPGYTPAELAKAYHRKVSEWHPDKLETMAQELKDHATRHTARINEAYERLRPGRV
jgi:DnaJ-class molecular chaperone